MKVKVLMIAIVIFAAAWSLRGQSAPPASAPSQYETRMMSLVELVGDSESGKVKIAQIAVQDKNAAFKRTDLDVSDYQQAFDRLAKDGWEPVTVNKSNYWVFRRLKRQG